jgi:Leucine-rich repeat (LRR) protein
MQVNLSRGKLGKMRKYKYEDITKLNISFNRLKELPKWIDLCINLQRLNCSDNQLTHLPERLPASLQWLDCGKNQLTHFPESLPDSLQVLYCSDNKLTQLPKCLLNALQRLYCWNNQLTQLSENLPVSLQILDCSDNQLRQLPKRLPASLQWLDCSINRLTILPLSLINYRNLTYINYNDNQIENIHPVVLRFINKQQDRNMHIYNDSQSVHNGDIQASIRQSIMNILGDKY